MEWTCKIDEGSAVLVSAYWSPDSRHILTTADFQLRLVTCEQIRLLGHAKWYHGFWFGPFPTQQAGGRFYSLCHYSSFQFKSDITTTIFNNNQVKQHANMLARLNNRSGHVPRQFRPLDKQYRTLRRSCKRERQAEVLDT